MELLILEHIQLHVLGKKFPIRPIQHYVIKTAGRFQGGSGILPLVWEPKRLEATSTFPQL